MTTRDIIELIVYGVIALVVLVYFIIKAIKNGWIQKITKTLNDAIKYAEKNIEGGVAKKEYVLRKVEAKCDELGIPFSLIYKLVNKIIDKVISNYNIIKK